MLVSPFVSEYLETMNRKRAAALLAVMLSAGSLSSQNLPLSKIQLPPGFTIDLYAEKVWNARSLALGPPGVVFVGTRRDVVYAVVDADNDNRADRVVTIARGLNSPNGVAFRDGSLYVAEIHRVIRFDNIQRSMDDPPDPIVVSDGFPPDRHHGWKFIRFGPDGKLYVPVGAPCNVCERSDERYASILRMNADGTDAEIYASGIRNTVGFDWDPVGGDLWFTDNGRDWMGDDQPPDELNHASAKGLHFGFPYIHGRGILDPEYGRMPIGEEFTGPAMELGAHVAALGMRFYTGKSFPSEYYGQILIAEHGSWNRSVPVGYRVTLVRLEAGRPAIYEVFAEGWLQGDSPWGRPVDVLIMRDGSLLVSDDLAHAIYRISYARKHEES